MKRAVQIRVRLANRLWQQIRGLFGFLNSRLFGLTFLFCFAAGPAIEDIAAF